MAWSRLKGAALGLVSLALMVGCSDGAPGETASAEVMERLEASHYVEQGEGAMTVYAFKDPHCPACTELREAVEGGATPSVSWRWIPVGFLGAGAHADAADMVEAAHPETDGQEAVDSNMRLAQELGVRSVPTVFYRDTEGQVRSFVGGDRDALDALERMAQ